MTTSADPISVSVALERGSEPPAIEIPLSQDLPAGAYVRVMPISHTLSGLVAESVALPDGTVCEEVLRFDMAIQRKAWLTHAKTTGITVVRLPRAMQKGETLRLTSYFGSLDYAGGDEPVQYSNEPARPCFAGMAWIFWLELAEGLEAESPRRQVSPEVHLSFQTGSPEKMQAIWKADDNLLLRHLDYSHNPVVQTGSVRIQAPDTQEAYELKLSEQVEKNCLPTESEASVGSRYRVTDSEGKTVLSNARPLTASGQKVCFGEFHWHCDLSSDGKRPLRDALRTAREELGLDFAGPSDHIWVGGDFGAGKTPEMQAEALREFDEPGRFAVLPGAEMSHHVGHANFYCDSIENYLQMCRNLPAAGEASRLDRDYQYAWDILTGALIPGHTVLVPHHPNMNSFDQEGVTRPETNRPYWNAMTFPRGRERADMRLYEIYQTRSSFEAEALNADWRIKAGGYGASVRSALMKGYRFGFTAGTDNHNGWPSRNQNSGLLDGLTAVLTDQIETASIWQALHARRCYATTGARIICDVTLNGYPIGSELKLAWDAERKMDIKIYGTAPLERVEVISAGEVLARLPVKDGSWDLETQWEDQRPGRPVHDVYYYLRIRQQDGNLAWLSPFWIDQP